MKDFIEKVKEKVVEGISSISSKSHRSLELMKLRTKLRDLEKEKNDKINELGRLVYDLFRRGDYSEQKIRDLFSTINVTDHQIVTTENEIKRVQETFATTGMTSIVVCECGAGLTNGQKFCSTCGKDVQTILTQASQTTEDLNRCPTCGAEIQETKKFCDKCGAKQ
jgi:hypothetical protein